MTDTIDPTSENVTVRMLLRLGETHEDPLRIAGLLVIVVGPASPSDWAGVRVEPGDVEGLHWTSREEVSAAVARLREAPTVIAVVA
jgi:hypothetical protein